MSEHLVEGADAISMVIPTRNRAYTLRLVAESYFQQDGVDEIVFVHDAGTDDTAAAISEIAARYQHVSVKVLRNHQRVGASGSRNRGVAVVKNKLVLFCDDDEALEANYATLCRQKLLALGAGAISGRRVYMQDGETAVEALARFGNGWRHVPAYSPLTCEHVGAAKFSGDLEMPFTNAVILTWTHLVKQYGFDEYYARGNGYREETDYQMNLYVHGHNIIQTNETHSIHLSPSTVRTGGQRVRRWYRVYWSIVYTRYFYLKYWDLYAKRFGLRYPRWFAISYYAAYSMFREYIRPTLAQLHARALR